MALLSGLTIIYSWPIGILFGLLYPSIDWLELYSHTRSLPAINIAGDFLSPQFSCDRLNKFIPTDGCENLHSFITLYMMGVAAAVAAQVATYFAMATQVRRLARSMNEDPVRTAWSRVSASYAPVYWIVLTVLAFVFYYLGIIHVLSIKFREEEFYLGETLFRYTIFNTFFMTFLMLGSMSVITRVAYRMSHRWFRIT